MYEINIISHSIKQKCSTNDCQLVGSANIINKEEWKEKKMNYGEKKRDLITSTWKKSSSEIQGDQKVSVPLMITIQKVTSNVQSVPRQSPDIY
jgi:hypothetical protein